MEAGKEIHTIDRLQIDWGSPGDNIRVEEDMKVRKGIDTAKSCISEKHAPEKNFIFLRSQIQA